MQKIGFMGLGMMGVRMAQRLLTHGCTLSVYNRTRSKTVLLTQEGAKLAMTPREVADGADVVFSMIDNDETSRALWTGDDGALAGAKPGTVLIECSTLSPNWIEELNVLAAQHDCSLIDAPVAGTLGPAEEGELLFMAGGDREVVDQARPVFEPLARAVEYVGPSGSGAKMKLVLNMMMATHVVNLAEALVLAENAGIDLDQVAQIVSNGAPDSRIVKFTAPLMTSGQYGETQFALGMLSKDLSYAQSLAEQVGVELPVASDIAQYFKTAAAEGFGDQQFAAIYESIKNHSGSGSHVSTS